MKNQKKMTTRKAKMREERYDSMDDVLRSGKYRGRTIREMLMEGNYIEEAFKRGSIVMSRSLWMKCVEYKLGKKMEYVERTQTTNQINSYKNASKRVAERANDMTRDTGEECIHELCWCAHHGCNHRNRTTCDQDIPHRGGALACGYSKNEDIFYNEINWE